MNNYEFCAAWVLDQAPRPDARVLDYGCGAGEIVKALRTHGVDAFGCDTFYEGGDYSSQVQSGLLDAGYVRKMHGDHIPFDDDSFDMIVNNQVMEHVEDIDRVLAELQRVLKPGGMLLSVFPDRGVWREGHCGIAFLHWFPKHSRPRIYYAALFRSIGFGYHKDGRGIIDWSRNFCTWLDDWTHYRTRREIDTAYGRYFHDIRYMEDYWLRRRLGAKERMVAWLPVPVQKTIVQKLGGTVMTASK
jgi:SAM-dependent methyltransferase